MDEQLIRREYEKRFGSVLVELSNCIENDVRQAVSALPRIDRISARPKSIDRFVNKALKVEKGELKYSDPLNQIQDQVGARITCFYLSDVEDINKEIAKYYKPIEVKYLLPESESE